jgi:hypothetical protein
MIHEIIVIRSICSIRAVLRLSPVITCGHSAKMSCVCRQIKTPNLRSGSTIPKQHSSITENTLIHDQTIPHCSPIYYLRSFGQIFAFHEARVSRTGHIRTQLACSARQICHRLKQPTKRLGKALPSTHLEGNSRRKAPYRTYVCIKGRKRICTVPRTIVPQRK